MSDDLNDAAIEAALSGHAPDEPLGQLLASIADRYASIPPAPPGPELAALMTGPSIAGGVVDRSISRRRRRRVVAAALTGTVLGKVVIGVSVAAASVAGMQASGIVQVPGLPGTHHGGLGSASPTTVTTTTNSSTTSTTPSIDPEFTQRLQARDAGTVEFGVADDAFLWVRPAAAAGWTHTLEQQPTTALVTFRGESGTISVDATIEGDVLHVTVLDQRDGSSDEFWFDGDGHPIDDPARPTPPLDTPGPALAPVDDDAGDDHEIGDHHEIDDDHDEDDHPDERDDRATDPEDEDDDERDDDRERSWSDDAARGAPLTEADESGDDDHDDADQSDDDRPDDD
jgi:hypothetical protein